MRGRKFVFAVMAWSLVVAGCRTPGGARQAPATPSAESRVPLPLVSPMPHMEARPGTLILQSPAGGVLAGTFTIDNPCLLVLRGAYAVRGDEVSIFIRWPRMEAPMLCLDADNPQTYGFRIAALPRGRMTVRFYDWHEGGETREAAGFMPVTTIIQ